MYVHSSRDAPVWLLALQYVPALSSAPEGESGEGALSKREKNAARARFSPLRVNNTLDDCSDLVAEKQKWLHGLPCSVCSENKIDPFIDLSDAPIE